MYVRSITFRCRPSSVRALLDSFSGQLIEEMKDHLRSLNLYQFIEMPPFQQEAPLTIQILSCWNVKKQVFIIGQKELAFTADEVAMIIGMPNRGDVVTWSSTLSKNSLINIRNTFKQHTIADTDSFVTLYIQFLFSNLFFPNNNYKVHEDLLKYATNIITFSKYNWAKAIWSVLLNQFDAIGKKFKNKKPLGYISGFVTVLVLWFFEHCATITPVASTATPRMMRWAKSVAWSTKQCAKIFDSLEQHQVYERFQGVSQDELRLLESDGIIAQRSPTPTPFARHLSPTNSSKSDNLLQIVLSAKQDSPAGTTNILESPLPSPNSPTGSSRPPSATSSPSQRSIRSNNYPPPSTSPTTPSNVDLFIFFKNLESKYNKVLELINDVQRSCSQLEQNINTKLIFIEEQIVGLDRRITCFEQRKPTTSHPLSSLIRGIKSRKGRKRKFLTSPFVSGQQKRRRVLKKKEFKAIKEIKEDKQNSDANLDNEAVNVLLAIQEAIDADVNMQGHHKMKRSFPWEEAVTISDSDSEEDKQDRAKRDKKDCSSENLKDITSEGTLIRMAGMYQEYMKRMPIPTFSGSIVPFTSWQGLAKSLKQLYGQPLHYLTNALLKQWDRERFGSDNEHQPLDAVVHPVKAQTLIWLTEELHRLTASPYHLAKLWACDPMYHSQIDPFLSY